MDRQQRPKGKGVEGLPDLSPEARARLQGQVAAVAAALEGDAPSETLIELVSGDSGDPNWDAHLMAALGGIKHPAIPALLARLFGAADDKVRRKALKKAMHRLRTLGVPVPADLLPREEVTVGLPRPGSVAVFVSSFFGQGESYIILEGPPEILGGTFLVSRISDQTGFKECFLLNLKRRQQAELWAQFREQGLDAWFSPPAPYAVRLLEEAYQLRPEAAGGAARYAGLRDKIWQHWGRPEAAPDLEALLAAVPPGEQARLLDQARKLALDPLFAAWMPGPEEIDPWFQNILAIQDSPLVLTEPQKQARSDAVLAEAVQALYPPEDRETWRRRLLAMAYCLHLSGREEDSRTILAAAADLAVTDRGALSGENPFLKALVQYALLMMWDRERPEEKPQGSGLLAPPDEPILIRR